MEPIAKANTPPIITAGIPTPMPTPISAKPATIIPIAVAVYHIGFLSILCAIIGP